MNIRGLKAGGRGVGPAVLGIFLVAAIAVGVGAGTRFASALSHARSPVPSLATSSPDAAVMPSTSPTRPAPTSVPTPSPAPIPTPIPTPEPTPVLVPAPLTGLPVTEAAAAQRTVAIMIDDARGARPQSGFNAAAQVWQAPAEGGIPRYMMIFQDTLPTAVGPIRSARQYYIEWAAEWTAMYVHLGGSPQAMTTLRAGGDRRLVYNADGLRFDGTQMWRIEERQAPHNVYTDAEHLRAMERIVGAKDGPIKAVWTFTPSIPMESRPFGASIVIRYPYETIAYRYDVVSNTYRRFIDRSKTQQIDMADGLPVAPTNVVILRMRFGSLNDGHPEKKRLEAHNIGSGEAIISTNGRIIKGTWKKASASAPTLLFGTDGEPVALAAGQTFVQVIALSYEYSVTEGKVSEAGLGIR